MPFSAFCDTLPKIAKIRYAAEFAKNPGLTLKTLFDKHLIPLSEAISGQSSNLIYVDEDITAIFENIGGSLESIYLRYFVGEVREEGTRNSITISSFSAVMEFLKSFDIFPSLVGKAAATRIWKEIIATSNTPQLLS
jgi:hypothetical protein